MRIEDIDRQFRELAACIADGESAFTNGDFVLAVEKYSNALPLLLSSYGETHEDSLLCLNRLTACYISLRKYDDALPLLRRLVATKVKIADANDPDIVQIYFNLATTSARLGRLEEAKEAYTISLALAERQYGPKSTFVASILESYAALVKREFPDSEEAKRLHEQLLELRANMVEQSTSLKFKKLTLEGDQLASLGAKNASKSDRNFSALKNSTQQAEGLSSSSIRETRETARKTPILSFGVAAVILCVALVLLLRGLDPESFKTIFSQFGVALNRQTTGDTKDSADSTRPAEEVERHEVYEAADGKKRMTLLNETEAQLTTRDNKLSGRYDESDAVCSFKPRSQATTFTFQRVPAGLIDPEGTTLYGRDASELVVCVKMRQLAKAVQKYCDRFQQFPTKIDAILAEDPELAYTNPYTGKVVVPVVGQNLGNQQQNLEDLTLDDYAAYQIGLSKLKLAGDQVSIGPGAIEFYRIRFSEQGDTFYIRGTDRNGKLLKSSEPGGAYVITLTCGRANR